MCDHENESHNEQNQSPFKIGSNRHLINWTVFSLLIFSVLSLHDSAPDWHPFYTIFSNPKKIQEFDENFLRPAYSRKDTADRINAFQGPTVMFLNENQTAIKENVSFSPETDKLILLWFDGRQVFHSSGSQVFSACEEKRCALTTNLDYFNQSAAVLFYAHVMRCEEGSTPEPTRAFPEQIFTFVMGESPINAPICGFQRKKDLFNWTMTYRLDSDVRAHYTYSVPVEKTRRNFAAGKTKLVAWLVSHCTTQSLRERYVAELAKYMPVDIYGKCGNLTCGIDCKERLKEYKFYLAFENSMCKDYVTEKIVNGLEHESVPIVYGDGNYRIFPPNSYIHTYRFSSPKKLADYLMKLDKNDTAYNELMKWRYIANLTQSHGEYKAKSSGFCSLCRKLHEPNLNLSSKSYPNIVDWWLRGARRPESTRIPKSVCRLPGWFFTMINLPELANIRRA